MRDFLFKGLRTIEDGDGEVYVSAEDFPLLVRRLDLVSCVVFGVDVFELRKGRLVYRDTVLGEGKDWLKESYESILRRYPKGWFSITYAPSSSPLSLLYSSE